MEIDFAMPVNPALLLGFLAMSAVLSLVPGPSVILATGRAITRGRTQAIRIVVGNVIGGIALLVLVVLGLGAIVVASATLFNAVKILGACYLLWLGIRTLLSIRDGAATDLDDATRPAETSTRRALREGFLVGVSNPKSVVALMAILPQFVDSTLGAPALQMMLQHYGTLDATFYPRVDVEPLVFVELLVSSEGIGYLMVWGRQLAQIDLCIVAMLVIGVIGIALELVLRWIESRLQGWRRAAF